jgi:lipopolysaccharide transport system ATP-binding protein
MGDVAIRVSGLSKQYRIGASRKSYSTLRDTVTDAVGGMVRSLRGNGVRQPDDTIWALKDVSFEVKRGEVLGIIGRNGAGKSTLLKILSRITEPTCGEVDVYGRVGSLLEVGTGFHPELTGRENVYLNGAVLGMRRREIQGKFDEIVDFSGIEKFIDTPVKHYSSGMYMRLAFAVAAHLEPEILLVDEVLAVGDAEFQKKCLAKMGEVAKEGRTVVFVSHNMTAIKSLCQRGILLGGGREILSGTAEDVVRLYFDGGTEVFGERVWLDPQTAPGDETGRIQAIRILDSEGNLVSQEDISSPITVEIEYSVLTPGVPLNVSISLFNSDEVHVLASASTTDPEWFGRPHPRGLFRSRCVIPGSFLNQGRYSVTALLVNTERTQIIAQLDKVVSVDIVDQGDTRRGYFAYWGGIVRPTLTWNTEHVVALPEVSGIQEERLL